MAKALLGTFHSDQRTSAHLLSENTRLRVRVRDLEELIARLQDENDRLAQAAAVAILDLQSRGAQGDAAGLTGNVRRRTPAAPSGDVACPSDGPGPGRWPAAGGLAGGPGRR